MIQQAACDGKVSCTVAASVHGRLNFASGFALGKALQPSAQGFSSLASGLELRPTAFADLCEHAFTVLKSLQPRRIATADETLPMIIYTDGAFGEDLADYADWGAILFDPVTHTRACYAGKVPNFLAGCLAQSDRRFFFCQIEMYAVLCVRWRMRHLLHGRRAVLFIDNEPCRYCLFKGRSPSDPLFRMAHACSCLEGAMPCYLWYERIASLEVTSACQLNCSLQ